MCKANVYSINIHDTVIGGPAKVTTELWHFKTNQAMAVRILSVHVNHV